MPSWGTPTNLVCFISFSVQNPTVIYVEMVLTTAFGTAHP